ncbi:MAG: hypothetical protein J2P50_11920 [Hyphomicrobiaceae bacterium]|nr:hypothetical protein [Hyphomicrobiaceae bacterium]
MGALAADFRDLELTDLAAGIMVRAISPVARTRALLDRISSIDRTLHGYTLVICAGSTLQRVTSWHPRRPPL